ncbi:metal-dependent hydrolase [Patiriisocius marinistellae]|uniref:Metal-dependent hydrolase n=1 Tax=Patiriisocius marinistellae TaxID=2494560 RepID=A0A5J4G147_9FLAO|nr:MBL fold metallo-hydrolase [Patiriisocius marinistellae]GEQ86216.1 metal-dependent hydrolase [Patiriisocius marinistellae]
MKKSAIVFCVLLSILSCKNNDKKVEQISEESTLEISEEKKTNFKITPISHATMVLEWDDEVIYVDPVGGINAFAGNPKATLVLVTDIHGDHFNTETLAAINENTRIIAPQAVFDKMDVELQDRTTVLENGKKIVSKTTEKVSLEAIPMYNLRPEALKFHEKGRGNGYIISKNGKRVYISGDTEDIPEMRQLKDIDVAFICMNLPYTMTVESAANAVLDFKPKKVYPYHYRGTDGMSDVKNFNNLIEGENKNIEVVQLDWYPETE